MQGPLQLVKHPGWTMAAKGAAGQNFSHLLYSDTHTGTRFLVDTGSEISAIPPSTPNCRHSPDNLTLIAVNNTPICMYNKQSLTLNLGLYQSFPWIFIIAEVQKHILGADFLQHFGLLVYMKLLNNTVQAHAAAWDHTSFIQCQVLPVAHGAQRDCW